MATTTTPVQSCEDALNRLTTTVNGILMETGRFFRTSGSMQSQSRLRATLPVANEEFQTALDYLSEQILLAKTVLEREYLSIQPAEPAQPKTSVPAEQSVDLTTNTQLGGQANTLATESTDLRGQEQGKYDAQQQQQQVLPHEAVAVPNVTISVAKDTLPIESGNPAGLVAASGPHDSQAAVNTSTISASPASGNVSGAGTGTGTGTFSSLLPGLESYANARAEEPSAPNEQATNNNGADEAKNEGRPAEMQMEDIPPAESNFDNMFVSADFGDGEELLNNVEIGDLDESWFT